MSKLLDKLGRLSEGRDQPLGFGAAVNRIRSLPILVIAGIPKGNIDLDYISQIEGVDALLVRVERHNKRMESLAEFDDKKLDIIWGAFIQTLAKEEIQQLVEKGCDFVVLHPDDTAAAVLREDRIGKILQVETSLSDDLAKAIRLLSVDAVLMVPSSKDEYPLTVRQLIVYARLAANVGKNLIASVPHGITCEDMESLWELGVCGVVVDIVPGEDAEKTLFPIMEIIKKLPKTRKKHGHKSRAMLPLPNTSPDSLVAEEDEEDDY